MSNSCYPLELHLPPNFALHFLRRQGPIKCYCAALVYSLQRLVLVPARLRLTKRVVFFGDLDLGPGVLFFGNLDLGPGLLFLGHKFSWKTITP